MYIDPGSLRDCQGYIEWRLHSGDQKMDHLFHLNLHHE